MSFHPLDVSIVMAVFLLVIGSAIYTRRYTRSVADFLSANRCAGRYLLTVAGGVASLGAVSIVGVWQKIFQGGFAAIHWGRMTMPLALILALTGFVIYRYRQTRAQTLAQFVEMRYSRRFRVFAGGLAFVSGVLNYGIFPAVTGNFLIYFLDLPIYETTLWVNAAGVPYTLNWTLGLVMAAQLISALVVTLSGGQIAVMVSDFVQGQLTNICFLALLFVLLWLISWDDIIRILKTAPAGENKLNPFDQGNLPDFHIWYFLMTMVISIYGYKTWQGTAGYNAAASSPHEAKMAGVLAEFRAMLQFLLIPLAAVCAWVLLHGDVRPDEAMAAKETLAGIDDDGLRRQLNTTVALKEMLPVGVIGLLTSVMIMAAISTDSTYLHSWGSIFVQDVVQPIRQAKGKKKLSPKHHLRLLRWGIAGVAIFAWFFSMLFPLQDYVLMYFAVTGAIFTGGAGAVILGGLYTRWGTTAGAWSAMLAGCTLAVGGTGLINLWPNFQPLVNRYLESGGYTYMLPDSFWLNGTEWAFGTALVSLSLYVGVSLLFPKSPIDFDKLYHRGKYAPKLKPGEPEEHLDVDAHLPRWQKVLGYTTEFTRGDKVIFALKYIFFFWQWGVGFLGLTIAYLVFDLMQTDDAWAIWWTIFLYVTGSIGVATTIWFLIGGIRDLFQLFDRLSKIDRQDDDDGTVAPQEHLGEPMETQTESTRGT